MDNTIKAALIVAAGLVVAAGLYVYFSPYQSCVRGYADEVKNTAQNPTAYAQRVCASMGN